MFSVSGKASTNLRRRAIMAQFIDTAEFTRQGMQLEGSAPLGQFARLTEGLPEQDVAGQVSWALEGVTDSVGRRFLSLTAQAEPRVQCQRCLGLFNWPLNVKNRVQVVFRESDLDRDDDPEAPECIVGSARFDVPGFVEDELILALPYVPRHSVCPNQADTGSDPVLSSARPSPFAVLEQLKKK
jgi:uncharacterized protein